MDANLQKEMVAQKKYLKKKVLGSEIIIIDYVLITTTLLTYMLEMLDFGITLVQRNCPQQEF